MIQEIIGQYFVKCLSCDNLIDLTKEEGVHVDSPDMPNLSFCSWKCLGGWITDVYQSGKQFEYGLEKK